MRRENCNEWNEISKGVKLFVNYVSIAGVAYYSDIDIDENVKEVEFDGFICLHLMESKKTFPNVESVKIGEFVEIQGYIPNSLFPNLKKLEIANGNVGKLFSKGTMIIKKESPTTTVKSILGCNVNPIVDLTGIKNVTVDAMKGFKPENVINTEDVEFIDRNAFSEYKATKENPFLMAGTILIDIYDGDKELEISKDINFSIAKNFCERKYFDKIIVQDLNAFKNLIRYGSNIEIKNLHFGSGTNEDIKNMTLFINDNFSIIHGLENITVDEGNKYLSNKDGILFSKDGKILFYSPKLKYGEYKIPDGTEIIMDSAFSSTRFSKITIPDSVKEIGVNAFSYSSELKEISFGKGITTIPNQCCCNCINLETVNFSDSLREVGELAFASTNIRDLTLPSNIKKIQKNAFSNTNISKIEIPKSMIYMDFCAFPTVKEMYFEEVSSTDLLTGIYAGAILQNSDLDICKIQVCNDEPIYILKTLSYNIYQELSTYFYFNHKDINYFDNIWDKVGNFDKKILYAIGVYSIRSNNEKLKEFLKRERNKIIKHLIKLEKNDDLIKFISFGLCTKGLLTKILEKAKKDNNIILTNYVLEEINKLKSDKINSKFSL